jgi:signal peptidase II
MGNTIDRINYQYVRNILFIPWFDNGTFNLADAIITISALCSLVFLLIMIWNSEKKEVNK